MTEERNRPRKVDLVGRIFTRLTCIQYVGKSEKGYQLYRCRCECGNEYIARYSALTSGNTKSCGCLGKENRVKANTTHGLRDSYYYTLWSNIKQRCFNRSRPDYVFYGGKGVTMNPNWVKDFKAFYSDLINSIGERPSPQLTLDRINYNGDYTVGNLRWASRSLQCFNRNFKISKNRGITKVQNGYKAIIHKDNVRLSKVFRTLKEAKHFYKTKCLELYNELPPGRKWQNRR